MSNASDRKQVIKDEADAEVVYLKSLEQAKQHAEALAKDAALSETKRVAAAEAVRALHKIEEARQKAHLETDPVAVKRTFWQWLTGD